MKRILMICLIVLFASTVQAYQIEKTTFDGKNFVPYDNGLPIIPNDWNRYDTALQVTFIGLMALDRYQTVTGISRGPFEEVGWARNFIGSHPTSGQVNRYFYTCVALHTAVSMAIPKDWEFMNIPVRNIWQIVWIGVEVNTTYKNYQLGLNFGLH